MAVCPCVVIIKDGHTHAILSPCGIPLVMYSCIARVTPQGGQLGNVTTKVTTTATTATAAAAAAAATTTIAPTVTTTNINNNSNNNKHQ